MNKNDIIAEVLAYIIIIGVITITLFGGILMGIFISSHFNNPIVKLLIFCFFLATLITLTLED